MSKSNNSTKAAATNVTTVTAAPKAIADLAAEKLAQAKAAAAAAVPNVAEAAENLTDDETREALAALEALFGQEIELTTVGEYIDRVEMGEIANPIFQSGIRWNDKQVDRFAECLKAHRPIPPLMVARIPAADGGAPLILRVDGNQRTHAINTALAVEDGAGDEDNIELIRTCRLFIQWVDCPSIEEAAKLFCDINNGSKLSSVQSHKAELPANVMAFTNDFYSLFESYKGKGGKFGKANIDTHAAICASVFAPNGFNEAANSSASALKLLKTIPATFDPTAAMTAANTMVAVLKLFRAKDLKAAAAQAAAAAAKADAETSGAAADLMGATLIDDTAASNKGGKESLYWETSAHFVPALIYTASNPSMTAIELADKLAAFDPQDGRKTSVTTKKGKTETSKQVTIKAAWTDNSNSKTAMYKRTRCLFAALANPDKGTALNRKATEEEKAAIEALTGAMANR